MKIELKRLNFKQSFTEGRLFIDGQYFCDTLEDRVRDLPREQKIYGDTAIPAGKYKVELSMSSRFKRVLPAVLSVPYFEGIRIHRGNTAKDTHGCILVGKRTAEGFLCQSTITEEALIKKLQGLKNITIEIK